MLMPLSDVCTIRFSKTYQKQLRKDFNLSIKLIMVRNIVFEHLNIIFLANVLTICGATISDFILNDLREAFRMIANDTQALNGILEKMYDLERTTPRILFNVPTTNGYRQVNMQHAHFFTPSFPNLTISYMKMMKEKWQNISTNSGDWTILGLTGWSGELSKPVVLQGDNINIEKEVESDYPSAHILAALDSVSEKITSTATTTTDVQWNNADVYIARANNPFGYSTKWQQKWNLSMNEKQMNEEDRSKRDVSALYSMIKCATHCEPFLLQGHGCYCGFLGRGVPEDNIDRCCQQHDKCYSQSDCINFIEYFIPYIWKCYRGKPLCAVSHGIWGDSNSCAARLCQCDLELSYCLRKQKCLRRRSMCSSSRARRIQNILFVK